MSVSKLCLRFLSFLSILLVVTLTASAQYRAGIHGTVLDAQGAVIPDAKVTVTLASGTAAPWGSRIDP